MTKDIDETCSVTFAMDAPAPSWTGSEQPAADFMIRKFECLFERNYPWSDAIVSSLIARIRILEAETKRISDINSGFMDYTIDLQRIIEDLCKGRDIRIPETDARHHYNMAVNFRATRKVVGKTE